MTDIEEELKNIGANFTIGKKQIVVKFPPDTTISSVPRKSGEKTQQFQGNYYFQLGTKIVFPKRHGYEVTAIAGDNILLSKI